MSDDQDNKPSKPSAAELFTTGEMAKLSDTTLRTVRFYEGEGLIDANDREGGSHRKFTQEELEKLQTITDLREAGLSLADIKALVAVKSTGETASEAAGQMGDAIQKQLNQLQHRIDTLQRVRLELISTSVTLEACEKCDEPNFPQQCKDCDVLNGKDRSRATHLLWKN